MFLDTNGDAEHTSEDVLNPIGTPTTVDVYLLTNQNRDGSPAVCNQDPEIPLTIGSYVFNLLAVNGTSQFTNFVNNLTSFTFAFGEVNEENLRYKNGFGGTGFMDPGKYKLATITITALTGGTAATTMSPTTATATATARA